MASIKELKLKVNSLQNTNRITSAMKMVSSSKLRRSQEAMLNYENYAQSLTDIINQTFKSCEDMQIDLQEEREIKKIRLLIISSDKGLCGAFNNALNRYGDKLIQDNWSDIQVEVETLGRKTHTFFRKKFPEQEVINYDGLSAKPEYAEIIPIVDKCINDFKKGDIDAVYIIYNQFISMINQKPTNLQLLPLKFEDFEEAEKSILFEPEAKILLEKLIPKYLSSILFNSLLENQMGEHVARMTAMENATNNSQDLIDRYTLLMNRARQSAITTELTEIVAGAESLEG